MKRGELQTWCDIQLLLLFHLTIGGPEMIKSYKVMIFLAKLIAQYCQHYIRVKALLISKQGSFCTLCSLFDKYDSKRIKLSKRGPWPQRGLDFTLSINQFACFLDTSRGWRPDLSFGFNPTSWPDFWVEMGWVWPSDPSKELKRVELAFI